MITKTQQYLLSKLPDKLMKHILVIESGCWLWQVNINFKGYGRVYIPGGKREAAHKFIYKLLNGNYDESLLLDHVYCKHRNCCNPTHVEPVTVQQNVHRGSAILIKKKQKFRLPPDDGELEKLLGEQCYVNMYSWV